MRHWVPQTRRVLSERTDSREEATPWSAARISGREAGSRGTIWWPVVVVMGGSPAAGLLGDLSGQKLRDKANYC